MTIAKPLPHDAAELHVTGQARYVDDVPLPANCLHLAFGLSGHARAAITCDLSAVRAAPEVALALAAADLDAVPDCAPAAHDEPLLAEGEVFYAGQPIFLVAAETHIAARYAATLGEIHYTPRPALLSIEDALAVDSRFEEGPRIWRKGDVDAALNGAPHIVEGSFEIGGQEHFYLEGQAALALPQEDGAMIVHSSSQHPTEIQHKVADALGLPMSEVRVEVRRMGGGFGGKESQGNHLAIACALMAQRTGRPCKMRYDRDDDFKVTGKRHDFRIQYRAGFDETGHCLGVDFTHYVRCGWAMDLSLPVADRAMLHSDNAYCLPAARITSHRLKTHTQSATAFRGFGGPQGMIGIERVMDHAAHQLGLDPLELRRRNYYPEADAEPTEATDNLTPFGMQVEDSVLQAMTERLARDCDYAARRRAIADWNAAEPVLKRGIALTPVKFGISFTLTHLNQAGALVHVYQDGSVAMNHGGTEMGQGLFRKVAQVAADRFGLEISAVKITATDTAKVPNTSATAASSGTDLNGMAVKLACDELRDRIAAVVAPDLQAAPEAIRFEAGELRAGGASMPWAEAVQKTYLSRVSLSATGYYATPKLAWDRIAGRGRPFFYFAYGVSCSEVVIDTLTGENRILRTDILHDCGASLNPAIDRGQIEGGFVQGAGWLTTEELVWNDQGQLLTHAPSTYKIPAMSDRPDIFNVTLWDQPNREETIYRSKAVGEPPFMHGISVFMALSDACRAAGPHFPDLRAPATAEAVMAAVSRARHGPVSPK
ncbi:MAG: xanthine dehydrogenase molybdopterin binding subunit [Pseudomonadota bacterium]